MQTNVSSATMEKQRLYPGRLSQLIGFFFGQLVEPLRRKI
jgi:hypothetical protein